MNTFSEDLRTLIINSPVGALVNNRVGWVLRPQANASLPGVVLTTSGEDNTYTYQGRVNYIRSRIQIEIFAILPAQAQQIYETFVEALSAYVGEVGNTEFQAIFLISKSDDNVEVGSASQQVVRTLFEIYCHWSEKGN